jgi:hypothetical protein
VRVLDRDEVRSVAKIVIVGGHNRGLGKDLKLVVGAMLPGRPPGLEPQQVMRHRDGPLVVVLGDVDNIVDQVLHRLWLGKRQWVN